MAEPTPESVSDAPTGHDAQTTPVTAADQALLDLLRCPLTHSRLRIEGGELVAEVGGLRYPMRDGIPVMLPEEAALPEGVATLDQLKGQLREAGQLKVD